MYLYFDHNGTLLETVSTTALRQNNIGVNKIYVHIQDEERPDSGKINESITGLIHRYKKSNGDIVNGTSVTRPNDGEPYQDGIFEKKQLQINKKRDLKHFVYGRDYEFFVLNIPSGRSYEVQLPIINADGEDDTEVQTITEDTIFDVAGPVLATISATDSIGGVMSLERIAFTVESSGNISDAPISASQFLWLLSEIIKIDRKVQSTNNYDTLTNRPIVNQDINASGFTPVAKTYYRDTNSGHIYFYDGKKRILINNLVAKDRAEFDAMVVSANLGQTISFNGNLYLIIDNNGIEARKIFNLNNIRLIDIRYGEIDRVDAMNDGIVWENVVAFGDDYSNEASALTRFRVPIVAGNHISFVEQGSTLKINADGVDDIKAIDTFHSLATEKTVSVTEGYGIQWDGEFTIWKDLTQDERVAEGKTRNTIPLIPGNGVEFEVNEKGNTVKINVTLPETTLNGEKVANPSFYAPTHGGNADGVNILVANGNGKAPDWKKLSLSENGQTITLKLGDVQIGSFTLDNNKYISDISYDSNTNKIVFTYADGNSKSVDLSSLVDDIEVGNGLEVEDGKIVLKVIDDYLCVDALFGLRTKAQEIADLAKINVNGQSAETKNIKIFAPEEGRVANSTQECYVLMPNGTSSAPVWGKFTIDNEPQADGFNTVFRLNGIEIGSVKHTQEIYLDSVVRDGNKIVFSYNTASGKKQVEVDLADLVDVYEAGNGLKRDGNTFSVKIEPNSTDFLEATADGIVFKKSALPEAGDKIEMLENATINLASLPPEIGVITESGIHYFVPEVELELPDGRFVYMQSRNALPITAGEGVEFKKNENNTVSINVKKQTFAVADKGKFLVVGDDGSIVAESMTIGENMLI